MNNPGNIEHSKDRFLGEGSENHPRFKSFVEPVYGIRAIAKILLTYYRKHHLDTVDEIIHRWAPPHENNTKAYVDHVCQVLRVRPYELIDVDDPDTLANLVKVIIKHENGEQPYDDATIERAVAMALEGGNHA